MRVFMAEEVFERKEKVALKKKMTEVLTYESLKNRVAELEKEIFDFKKAEEILIERENRFRTLVETVSDIIWEIDQQGLITHVSNKVAEILGYQPDTLIGKSPFDFMPLRDKDLEMKFHALATSQLPFDALENRFRHKDGRLIILKSCGVPIFDVKGHFCGYRCISRDITQGTARAAPLAKVMRLEALWVISTRSPRPANITVCSPTMSPARIVSKPMVLRSRSPVTPSRP